MHKVKSNKYLKLFISNTFRTNNKTLKYYTSAEKHTIIYVIYFGYL